MQKCQIFTIFMTAEIHKIDLEALFSEFEKSPSDGKNLDLWVKIRFVQKTFSWGITDFTEANF